MSIVLALLLSTTTFRDGAPVPQMMAAARCGGGNVSPSLSWSAVPPGGFYHWVAYNIPGSQRVLPRGAGGLGAGKDGRNSTGSIRYFGPCPPSGKVHHYHFTLYALDVSNVDAGLPLTAGELLERVRGHVLAEATITGTYQR
jgi:phosphatidylethanolamine-binding protein (PEBP) family uncharacterized protein